ncbi:hypothetical protein AWJ20_252 [Sugiyamaella lignohabitans]|uniref:Major facilitator superfamily (MFS) profile domain-containing protein n=1 Tax=Sugiyamaella lignohabitans TaxID=796027 RepID=A0A167CRF8_9ASCO|nr:uncharacterized protein AWJ20_252 [Sugiyamaella lignohabitans]ANB12020.1 hypothetical protein AWJ20_252 [Sugiyamaella lignohabitans]
MLRDVDLEHQLEEDVQNELHIDLPPGTELMHDVGHIHFAKKGNTVLIPQPDNNPNDPLNWSKPWKYSILIGSSLLSFIHQIGGLSIAPQVPFYVEEFNRSADDVLLLTGVYILLMGLSTWFWIPISEKYGRRIVILSVSQNIFDIL